jgi:hypothetical protein
MFMFEKCLNFKENSKMFKFQKCLDSEKCLNSEEKIIFLKNITKLARCGGAPKLAHGDGGGLARHRLQRRHGHLVQNLTQGHDLLCHRAPPSSDGVNLAHRDMGGLLRCHLDQLLQRLLSCRAF